MPGIFASNPASSRFGKFRFSIREHVHRLTVKSMSPFDRDPIPQGRIHAIATDSNQDFLLAVSPRFVPESFELQRIENYPRIGVQYIVLCSALERENEWAAGFVIERGEGNSPFHFSKEEIAAISGEYLPNPHHTIFINNFRTAPEADSARILLEDSGYLPPVAFFTGYLKAGPLLESASEGTSLTGLARYETRSYYAALYASAMTENLSDAHSDFWGNWLQQQANKYGAELSAVESGIIRSMLTPI